MNRMPVTYAPIAVLTAALLLGGCYSFRGGSAPAHLSTIVIPQADDASGAGRTDIRFDLTDQLQAAFRDDNSLRVTDDPDADSRLEVTVVTVRTDIRRAVSADDRETARGVVVEARCTFYDNVRSRAIYDRKIVQGESSYDLSEGYEGEQTAIAEALEALTNNILLATVADW